MLLDGECSLQGQCLMATNTCNGQLYCEEVCIRQFYIIENNGFEMISLGLIYQKKYFNHFKGDYSITCKFNIR